VSSDLSLSSASWANVDTGLDITIPAATGDTIRLSLHGRWGAEANHGVLDVVTVVSGSPVNSVAQRTTAPTSTGTGNGLGSWWGYTGVASGMGSPVFYPVVAGDISGGNVVFRLRYYNTSSTKTINATATSPLVFMAENLGVTAA
jgi:hypothetical protein